MASRDLTAAFIERRKSCAANLRHRGGGGKKSQMKPFSISKKLSAGGGQHDDLMLMEEGYSGLDSHDKDYNSGVNDHVPPQWVDEVDAIHTIFKDITRQIDTLTALHSSRLGSVFGSSSLLSEKEMQIDQVTHEITSLFRHAEKRLQRVGNAAKQGATQEDTIVLSNVQRSLARKLQEVSSDFRSKQRRYLKDVQAQKSGYSAENEEHKQFGIDLNADKVTFDNYNSGGGTGFNNQQMAVVEDMEDLVQSRDEEIVKIAQSIEELGTIFKELAVLVIDQGTVLDRIDYNMEAVVEHTREGIQQLEKAEAAQKSARPMKCIIVLLLIIAILVVILVLQHT